MNSGIQPVPSVRRQEHLESGGPIGIRGLSHLEECEPQQVGVTSIRWLMRLIGGILLTCSITLWGEAQDSQPTDGQAKQVADPLLAQRLRTPQATLRSFIDAVNSDQMSEAAQALDLSDLDKDIAFNKGPELAFKLKGVLDRMFTIDYSEIPDDPAMSEPFSLGEVGNLRGLVGQRLEDAATIILVRKPDGLWRFSQETVGEIESLWKRWKDRPRIEGLAADTAAQEPFSLWLESRLSNWFPGEYLLLPNYQWVCLLFLIAIGFLADGLTRWLLGQLTILWFRYWVGDREYQPQGGLWKPVGLLSQAYVWYFGTWLIGLPVNVLSIVVAVVRAFTAFAAVWTGFRLIDLLSNYLHKKAQATATKLDDLMIPIISKSLKVAIVCVSFVVIADIMGWRITGVLTSLGIGGVAVAFAAKDTLGNFFGSLMVLVDRPFEIGDWIIADGVEGTVETVGLRSTRVRTFYNSLITVPNVTFTTAKVDNMGRRRYRRISTRLGVQYDSRPEQIEAFCEGIRELIRRHPYTRKDYYHVYFNAFGDSALEILLYCFLDCPDWAVELRERHRLLLDIFRLADELNVSFAFPTRTLHLVPETTRPGQPGNWKDPHQAGREIAARVAGPALSPQQRPGRVEFPPGPLGWDASDLADLEGDG